MNPFGRARIAPIGLVVAALAAAGCGGSGGAKPAGATAQAGSEPAGQPLVPIRKTPAKKSDFQPEDGSFHLRRQKSKGQ